MMALYIYNPMLFYSIVMVTSLVCCPIAAYCSKHKKLAKFQLPSMFFCLSMPCITALVIIYTAHNEVLMIDFWKRLLLFKISTPYLLFILLFMPCVILLATWISILFGYTIEQFYITKEMSAMKGWATFGIAIPLLLAPFIEELGWRGYGVDCLRANFNLGNTSLIFGFLWAIWHMPAFFVRGYYQNELWSLGIVYVINFFMSTMVIAIFMNWVYYKTDRSIPAMVLFHAILNFSSMILRTKQFTKCIATILLCIVAIMLIIYDRSCFFNDTIFLIK